MKKYILYMIIGIFTSLICSCATIMRDNSQSISFAASTDKVNIKILNKSGVTVFEGQTPTTINLKTSASGYFNPEKYTVIASKDGYKTNTAVVDWHVSGWYYVGNLVFGGLIGYLIIDPISGDMYYMDENVHLNMEKENK